MDWLDMLLGAALLATGYVVGHIRRRPRGLTKEPEPICGCEHHYSFHDETDGCNWKRWQWERIVEECHCKKYTGPEPLPTYVP